MTSAKTPATLIWVFCVGPGAGTLGRLLACGKPPQPDSHQISAHPLGTFRSSAAVVALLESLRMLLGDLPGGFHLGVQLNWIVVEGSDRNCEK